MTKFLRRASASACFVLMMIAASLSVRGEDSKLLKIVALGDSLTAGYGLQPDDAFPVKLEAALRKRGHNVRIHNAGVSGDTLKGGLARLAWAVPDGTDGVIVELGANDALRGVDPAQSRRSLEEILTRLKARNIPVLLAGMRAPQNFGATYSAAFDGMYPDLAKAHGVDLYPFFLDGVALKPELNQADGIHPNAKGVDIVVSKFSPSVEKFIQKILTGRRS